MTRSGYDECCENLGLYRRSVANAVAGKRGQAYLREMRDALDSMEVKELTTLELVDIDGKPCSNGAVCLARGLDTSDIDDSDPVRVGKVLGISTALAAEVSYINDEHYSPETDAERWTRMRAWAESNIVEAAP